MQAEECEEVGEEPREGSLIMSALASQYRLISARPALRGAVSLLESAGLPTVDLRQEHLEHLFYCGTSEAPKGLVGLELHGADALLRSLVVTPAARGSGLGAALVEHAEGYARSRGVQAMYLLTSTAERFFAHRGYLRIARAAVSPAIQGTQEFAQLCPESSALMAKAL
jgi:amino-acid N-acetyltransferase